MSSHNARSPPSPVPILQGDATMIPLQLLLTTVPSLPLKDVSYKRRLSNSLSTPPQQQLLLQIVVFFHTTPSPFSINNFASSINHSRTPHNRLIPLLSWELFTFLSISGVVIGPATVGGIQDGAFKIGDTAGTIDDITLFNLSCTGLDLLDLSPNLYRVV
ncbi:ATP-citrate synthase beta chain protein [Orobanche minor]